MEPVMNFISMFEQSIGLKEPWEVERAEFSEDKKAVHIYVSAKKQQNTPVLNARICAKDTMMKTKKGHGAMEM